MGDRAGWSERLSSTEREVRAWEGWVDEQLEVANGWGVTL